MDNTDINFTGVTNWRCQIIVPLSYYIGCIFPGSRLRPFICISHAILCISLDSIAVSLFTIIAIITNIHHHSLSSLLFIIIHYYHYYSSSFTIITIIHHHSLLSLLFTIIIWRSVPLFYGRHFFSATGAVVWSGFCLQEPFQPNAACPAQLSILPDKHGCASAANQRQRQRFSDIAVPLCAKWLLPAGIHRVTNIHKSPFSILNWII